MKKINVIKVVTLMTIMVFVAYLSGCAKEHKQYMVPSVQAQVDNIVEDKLYRKGGEDANRMIARSKRLITQSVKEKMGEDANVTIKNSAKAGEPPVLTVIVTIKNFGFVVNTRFPCSQWGGASCVKDSNE